MGSSAVVVGSMVVFAGVIGRVVPRIVVAGVMGRVV